MPNRLTGESSPYLLQHANNPVDWYPWGAEARARAKSEDKPIFLSIGYSACHWCHVMEHESFENHEIAAQLNESFVCIKVDREERPDLDQIYMNAVQLMTGRGGWPMSVFLTPDLQPFYGGTYWPPHASRGMPGFDQVLAGVNDAWQNRRAQAVEQAGELTEHLRQIEPPNEDSEGLRLELLKLAGSQLEKLFDFANGGFGRAPKFPHAMDLQLLLRISRRWPSDVLLEMVRLTLDKMARGGIYDHLAGGFARYSTDERWLVPHFEKMLYDNALLSSAYLDGYLATGHADFARIARETFDYTLAYMTDDAGGFHSTEDADSEGVEGKFYVWTPAEIADVLGPERAARFCYLYDVSEAGNFEHGQSILNLPKTIEQCAVLRGWNLAELQAELAEDRAKLLAVRDRRVRPAKDDKILVSWNALMIDCMARGAGVLGEPKYLVAAARAAEFLLQHVQRPDGRLLHSWRQGQAKFDAYLDDYAYLISALITLYEASFEERWIDEAVRLANLMLARFADKIRGGFFFTADDHEQLIARQKDLQDSSVPSGNSMAATALLRLGALCGRVDYTVAAHETLNSAVNLMERSPAAAGQMLLAADMSFGPLYEIVILGDPRDPDTTEILADLRRRFIPNRVIACRPTVASEISENPSPRESLLSGLVAQDDSPELEPIFVGKVARDGLPAVFICQDFTCHTPASGKAAVLSLWSKLAAGSSLG